MPSGNPTPRVPSYRRHKPSGQAVVTLNGKDRYLGKWNTKASRVEFNRLVGAWLAGGGTLPFDADSGLPCGFSASRTAVRPWPNSALGRSRPCNSR